MRENVVDRPEHQHDQSEYSAGEVEAVAPVDDDQHPPVEAFVAGIVDPEFHGRQDPLFAFADGLGQGDEARRSPAGKLPGVSEDPAHHSYWRVGHTGDPLGFVPLDICEYSHRFDDLHHRFRTVYVGELAETCLREPLADFRPKLSTIRFFQREMGAEAATDLPAWPITAAWRREHVLAPLRLTLDGP